jgi:type 1 fimbriae regulatory protein FimB
MAERTFTAQAGRQKFLHRGTAPAYAPFDRQPRLAKIQRGCRPALSAHPHMLRHACAFALGDQGADTRLIQGYLGHRSIRHNRAVHREQSGKVRFEKLWR